MLENKVSEIQRDVTANTTRVNEAGQRIIKTEQSLKKTQAALETATKHLAYLEAKTDDLENRGRSKNIRLLGLQEGAQGKETLSTFISNMLPRWLELGPDRSFTLEWAHHTLASERPNQTRVIIIRFLNFQEK